MIDINKAIIARLKKGNEVFEVLVDCDKAMEFRSGKVEIDEALAGDEVYKDAKKGEKASEHEMKNIFGTDDKKLVAEIIVKDGEIHLTTEHRNKLREEKRKNIVSLIHRNAIDSKTSLPHPPNRIEAAMEEARVNIDEFKSPEAQIEDVLEKIRGVLPIKFVLVEVEIKIPGQFTGGVHNVVKQLGKILKEEWANDGSLVMQVEIPGGLQEELFDKLNSLTHGEVESKILKEKE
ncbi:MAG: ribosome assembly factor SBDS [Nanoarchaeota archaeon]|nr:ribosome assembly factor SBDS [Nanoarchaeota archaeon]|tara:strand:+ start:1232 stop:1933 length:702 start_codon:yes stop_codon:yes gene_type:complete